MAANRVTFWDSFLKPVFGLLLNSEEISQLKRSIDWEEQRERFSHSGITYPDYYRQQNFQQIPGGYLSIDAVVTYDLITQYLLSPNETWVRQSIVDNIGGKPRRILDLGCGTGSTTLMLKQAFPQADAIGIDLSSYMLVMADYKAQKAGLTVQWQQGQAEATNLPPASFDLVTASLLLRETPPSAARAILRECFRLLRPGGQVIVLDANQKALRQAQWLTEIVAQPDMRAYASESIEAWMGAAGFEAVQTQDLWLIHQVTKGIKPTRIGEPIFRDIQEVEVIDAIPV